MYETSIRKETTSGLDAKDNASVGAVPRSRRCSRCKTQPGAARPTLVNADVLHRCRCLQLRAQRSERVLSKELNRRWDRGSSRRQSITSICYLRRTLILLCVRLFIWARACPRCLLVSRAWASRSWPRAGPRASRRAALSQALVKVHAKSCQDSRKPSSRPMETRSDNWRLWKLFGSRSISALGLGH